MWQGAFYSAQDREKQPNTGESIVPELNLNGIGWAIVGGESGPKARPMELPWVTEIRDQCLSAKVPFFFKQWGGVNKKKSGRLLDGRTWDEMPMLLKAA